jgi:uncharacterized protein YchJ
MPEQYVTNQHYISQCILKQFANSKDQVYETLVEAGKLYATNYKNSMVERFTYEHPDLEKNKVEKYFQKIEDYIGPAVYRIINTIEEYERGECSFSEIKESVSQYMREFIMFYYRSGALLTEFEFERKVKVDRVFLMLQNVMNSHYIKELSKTVINYYNFAIIKSENNEFLLSDQYLSSVALAIKNRFFNVSNRHIGMRDVMLLIPLSGKYYAVFYDGHIPSYLLSNKVNELSQVQVDEINEVIINNSYTKCIGNNREALERALTKFEYQSPAATFSGGNGIHMGATLKKEVFLYATDKRAWELFTGSDWFHYRDLGRNDRCACGSGKKFKKCCSEYIEICVRMYDDIENNRDNYRVNDNAIGEKGIAEFNSKS